MAASYQLPPEDKVCACGARSTLHWSDVGYRDQVLVLRRVVGAVVLVWSKGSSGLGEPTVLCQTCGSVLHASSLRS